MTAAMILTVIVIIIIIIIMIGYLWLGVRPHEAGAVDGSHGLEHARDHRPTTQPPPLGTKQLPC
jgi:hypothetical protein